MGAFFPSSSSLSVGGGSSPVDGAGVGRQAGGIPTRGIFAQENSELLLLFFLFLVYNLSEWNVIYR